MLDIKLFREQPDVVRAALKKRNTRIDLKAIIEADVDRRAVVHEMEQLRAEQNRASEEIGARKKAKEEAAGAIAAVKCIKSKIAGLEEEVRDLEAKLSELMLAAPNIPHESVPDGADEKDNRVERSWGAAPAFDFDPKDHVEVGEGLGILDFDCSAKLAGTRFSFSSGAGARLERALINFMLDTHTEKNGYTEVLPPFVANTACLTGTGQLPKFAEDLFHLEGTDYHLIPTAEVPLTNIHRDEILEAEDLPICYAACTPCFRSEAGSYGKDTRGMIRVHQFNKVEMVKFCRPEDSWDDLERLTENAEALLQALGLPYRVVTLCGGDLGFSAAKTYDLEVWLPGQNRYREISSCSHFSDFQARRANIRYRTENRKPAFVHTVNGSGLAVGRCAVAILENYQQADGSVVVPEALRSYMGGLEKITR